MRAFRLYFVPLILVTSGALWAKTVKVANLAKLLDYVITDRQVAVDEWIENPAAFSDAPGASHALSKSKQDEALDRVLVQFMIVEENRLFANERVSDDEIRSERARLLKKFGDRKFKALVAFYELSESEIKEKLREKILFRKALATKLRSSRDNPETAFREWIKQLKSRYKPQYFLREGSAEKRP